MGTGGEQGQDDQQAQPQAKEGSGGEQGQDHQQAPPQANEGAGKEHVREEPRRRWFLGRIFQEISEHRTRFVEEVASGYFEYTTDANEEVPSKNIILRHINHLCIPAAMGIVMGISMTVTASLQNAPMAEMTAGRFVGLYFFIAFIATMPMQILIMNGMSWDAAFSAKVPFKMMIPIVVVRCGLPYFIVMMFCKFVIGRELVLILASIFGAFLTCPFYECMRNTLVDPDYFNILKKPPDLRAAILRFVAFFTSACFGAATPVAYIILDTMYIAKGRIPGLSMEFPSLRTWRPLLMIACKTSTWMIWKRMTSILHWPIVFTQLTAHMRMDHGKMTALGAAGCTTVAALFQFMVIDWVSWTYDLTMFSSLFENSPRKQWLKQRHFQKQFQRSFCTPARVKDWQAFEMVSKGIGTSGAFMMLLIAYPLLHVARDLSPLDSGCTYVLAFLFPLGRQSLYFIGLATASDLIQDIAISTVVGTFAEHPTKTHGKVWGWGARRTIMVVLAAGNWVIVAIVHFAFMQL